MTARFKIIEVSQLPRESNLVRPRPAWFLTKCWRRAVIRLHASGMYFSASTYVRL